MKIYIALLFFLISDQICPRTFTTICRSLYRSDKAIPCTNQKLLHLFFKIQQELRIRKKIPLFETEKRKNYLAVYCAYNQAVVLNKNIWEPAPDIVKKQTLYHELRHHEQFQNPNRVETTIENLVKAKGLTYGQANEYDADHFGMIHATKNCMTCLKELQKQHYARKPKKYEGYFIKRDFDPIIQEARKNLRYCKKHRK